MGEKSRMKQRELREWMKEREKVKSERKREIIQALTPSGRERRSDLSNSKWRINSHFCWVWRVCIRSESNGERVESSVAHLWRIRVWEMHILRREREKWERKERENRELKRKREREKANYSTWSWEAGWRIWGRGKLRIGFQYGNSTLNQSATNRLPVDNRIIIKNKEMKRKERKFT